MKFIQGIFIFSLLFFAKFGHAKLTIVDNQCSRVASGLHTDEGLLDTGIELSNAQIIENGVRFLGFDIVDVAGVKHLSARFAGQNLKMGFGFVRTDRTSFMCGRLFGGGEHKRSSWAINMPVEEALAHLKTSNDIAIQMYSIHLVNGEEKRSFSRLRYHKPALEKLLKKDITLGLPYDLAIEHPIDLVDVRGEQRIVYCLNSNYSMCDYSIEDHPRYHDFTFNDLGIALPFKGQFSVDGYITRILFKEDITTDMRLAPTEFGLWQYYGGLFELGALRGDAKAFLSQFFTLSYSNDPVTGSVVTNIAWDIPMEHGEFLDPASYMRDYRTYLMMNFAFEVNRLGSLEDALRQGYSEAEYVLQSQLGSVTMTGLEEARTGAFKQMPLTVTFP
ncbi:hypothetical protein [Pseudoalteromonas luteoviolacea]|uniref:hypothetical protein n=1 Tax=Pseudoalteromonas luteoviolacea TaxID=43657 RepID=UPI001152983C|nr:hypothetical protein [Pseudoalteromonas luteoviolacea]TQF71562.1 hypothetical protein FLM44_10935 [Pseudoalteromonas luteoviolacea]